MSKKFFTLIHGDRVEAAPTKKVIPAAEFSSLKNASEILEHTLNDSEKYRIQIAEECEIIKEGAYRDGYEEGFKEWAEQMVCLEKEIANIHLEIQRMVVPIAVKAAKKMVGRELEVSEDTIVDIVSANIKGVAQHKKIIIYVNKHDWEVLEKNKGRIKELFEDLQSLSIRPRDDVDPGGCIIETEIGIINAQMEHRWNVLEKAFEKLMKTSPETLKGS